MTDCTDISANFHSIEIVAFCLFSKSNALVHVLQLPPLYVQPHHINHFHVFFQILTPPFCPPFCGQIFIGTHGGHLYRIISGRIAWRLAVGDVIYGSPFVVSDGGTGAFVAVATRGGRLLLVDAKGEEILGSAEMSGEVWLDGDR